MATTATVRHSGALHRHRFIERPRLLALLDGSTARVRMLVAPAGYGKTTLASQWIAQEGRRGAWFVARRSSTDVAALALGLARSSTALVADCDARLREHLRAVPSSAENVDLLTEILGEDLAGWPSDGWLVVDEYHEIAAAEEAERLVAALVAASPAQLLVAGRQRPSWATARRMLYGEILELDQAALAMDTNEAAQVLSGRTAQSASGLVELANGWPAVIGLAGVSSAEVADREAVPESLYRFFAEEVFAALSDDVQAGLVVLATAPVLDRDLATELLGAERGDAVCAAALDVGILVERESRLELHPLARSFLEERSEHKGLAPPPDAGGRCLSVYRARRDWDAAFDVIGRQRLRDELEPLVLAALDDLLATARLQTLETWLDLAQEWELETPGFALARAEVALRQGRFAASQTHAETAARASSALTFRALSTGGRAAHLSSNEEKALDFYERAEAAANTEAECRDALWGQLMCSIELELPEAATTLDHLTQTVNPSDLREVVRAATCRLSYQMKLGLRDLAFADAALELIDSTSDPLVVSGFQSGYSAVLALTARYEEAAAVAKELLDTARRYRLDFAIPYALNVAALASAGLRQWSKAETSCSQAQTLARERRDANAEQLAYSIRTRILAQQGRTHVALSARIPALEPSLPSSRAEVQCSRALVLALVGRVAEARALVEASQGLSRAIEPSVLGAAVDAICALETRADDAPDVVNTLAERALSSGALDLLVTAYRSAPTLLAVLLRSGATAEPVRALVRLVHDDDLARAVGFEVASSDPRALLTAREREVFALVRQGMTNTQIAKALFIEESTVKVHIHHIYDKLGIRSRTTLAVQAALERADQATSAIDDTVIDGDS